MNKIITAHEFQNYSNQLIKEYKNNEFITLWDTQWLQFQSTDFTKVYKQACESGNVIVVDYLLTSPLNFNIDIKFPYSESIGYEEAIPNGAIFLAGENHSIDLLEYFIKNDVYYIDSATTRGLENYMISVIDIINQIEFKLHIEDKLNKKDTNNTITITQAVVKEKILKIKI